MAEHSRPIDVRHVWVRTFAAADGLAKVIPESTEEAQYSLLWPLAGTLARGRFGVDEVLGPFADPAVGRCSSGSRSTSIPS